MKRNVAKNTLSFSSAIAIPTICPIIFAALDCCVVFVVIGPE